LRPVKKNSVENNGCTVTTTTTTTRRGRTTGLRRHNTFVDFPSDTMNEELMEFLVGKKATTAPTTPGRADDARSPAQQHHSASSSPSSRKGKASSSTVAAAFYKVLVQQWLDADRFAEDVLRSVVNLQDRIAHELVLVDRMRTRQQLDQKKKKPPPSWKSYGYRSNDHENDEKGSFLFLTLDDIQMTLDRDLLQHEAMLGQLRRTVSTMAQALDAMGRRLSEWYGSNDEAVVGAAVVEYYDDVETAQSLYVACAEELYRKQIMVQTICDASAMDMGNALSTGTAYNSSTTTTARECLSKWNRLCADSYLVAKRDEIIFLLQRYE
jgi:hypothetical protein